MLVEYSRPVLWLTIQEIASITGLSYYTAYHFVRKKVSPLFIKVVNYGDNKAYRLVSFDFLKQFAEAFYEYQKNVFRSVERKEHINVWNKGMSALVRNKVEGLGLKVNWGGISGISNLYILLNEKLKTTTNSKEKETYKKLIEGVEAYERYNSDIRDFPIVIDKVLFEALAKRWHCDDTTAKRYVKEYISGWRIGEGRNVMKTIIYSVWEVYYLLLHEADILRDMRKEELSRE